MHGRPTGKHKFTRLTTARTWGEVTIFPLITYFVHGHGANTQMSFCPEIPKLRLPQLCRAITLCVDLQLRWGLKQSCSLCQELSNGMSHSTFTQGNRGDSRRLVIGIKFDNLTLDLSFGHNLCLRCPNGSCEPILDIYVPRVFQWYKELFNPMNFNPCNPSLKIWESI